MLAIAETFQNAELSLLNQWRAQHAGAPPPPAREPEPEQLEAPEAESALNAMLEGASRPQLERWAADIGDPAYDDLVNAARTAEQQQQIARVKRFSLPVWLFTPQNAPVVRELLRSIPRRASMQLRGQRPRANPTFTEQDREVAAAPPVAPAAPPPPKPQLPTEAEALAADKDELRKLLARAAAAGLAPPQELVDAIASKSGAGKIAPLFVRWLRRAKAGTSAPATPAAAASSSAAPDDLTGSGIRRRAPSYKVVDGKIGDASVDLQKLAVSRKLEVRKNGRFVLKTPVLAVPIALDLLDLLSKRHDPRRIYAAEAQQLFAQVIDASGAPPRTHSGKHRMLLRANADSAMIEEASGRMELALAAKVAGNTSAENARDFTRAVADLVRAGVLSNAAAAELRAAFRAA